MSRKICFLISFVLVLGFASFGYGDAKVDFDDSDDPNVYNSENPDTDVNSTEPGYVSMVIDPDIRNLGSLGPGDIVNGIQIDFYGDIDDARRASPNDVGKPPFPEFQINEEGIHRDFICGLQNKPINIDLWGLGAGRKCDIHIWAFDDKSIKQRIANWTANDANLLQTSFIGGDENKWPRDGNPGYEHYDFNGIGYADELGHIYLTCEADSNNELLPFAFANALEVILYGDYNNVPKAHRPKPFDGTEDVPIDTKISWRPGDVATTFDVYLSTDPCDLTLLATVAGSNSIDPYGDSYLAMEKTYYLRVDANAGGTVYTGDVSTFTTSNNWVVDTFDSYNVTDDLTEVWSDYYVGNGTSAVVEIAKSSEGDPAVTGNSMEYHFDNTYDPYYSESWVILDDTDLEKETDKNFITTDVQSLSVWFYGQESNPVNEKMYVKLIDDDGESAKVLYSTLNDMNDITVEEWHEWNIAIQEFIDNNAIDLTDVNRIVIGFDEGTPHADGRVYFDNIRLYTKRCVLVERSAELARADYAPVSNEDCIVDDSEVEVISRDWLSEDSAVITENPTDANLVLYYPFNEGDGNRVHPEPNDPCWIGLFWNSSADPPGDLGTTWAKDSRPLFDNNGVSISDGNCVYMTGLGGGRITCGTLGSASLGFAPTSSPKDSNGMTLSLWVKWLGRRYFDPYLYSKSQGLMGKRGAYDENGMIWTFWISANPGEEGGIGLGNRIGTDLVSPAGTMDPFIGEWVHIAVTYPHPSGDPCDPNEFARIYVGGFQVQEGEWHFSHGDDANLPLTIGQTTNETSWPECPSSFYGYIDEVRIYNRALEPNEVGYLADPTPEDGVLQIPIPSPSEIYKQEPEGSRVVNFKDFAIMASQWLKEELWP